jgi:hypothetical protein
MARETCRELGRVADAFEAERWGSWFHGRMWDQREKVPASRHLDWAFVLGAPLADEIAAVGDGAAKAALMTLAWLDGGPLGALCRDLEANLDDVETPAWADGIGTAELTRAATSRSPGDGEVLVFDVQRPGDEPHTLVVYIDELNGGIAKHLRLLRGFDEVAGLLQPSPSRLGSSMSFEFVDLTWACDQAQTAIELTDGEEDPPLAEFYADHRAIALARLAPYLTPPALAA